MKIKDTAIEIVKGDITVLDVDAIVNAANTEMIMDSGVAKVIKEKGGETIESEAMSKKGIEAGEAFATSAGQLSANFVIHAAINIKGEKTNQDQLRTAMANALRVAQDLNIQSFAIPALGCGFGGFPLVGAAKIMVQEIMKLANKAGCSLKEIKICLFDQDVFKVFNETIPDYIRHMTEDLGPQPYKTCDIIIELPEGIILIERSNPPYGWALPGGFLDPGESPEVAAVREAKEETNMDLEDLSELGVYDAPDRDPRFHTSSTIFIAKGVGTPQFGDDAKGLKIVKYEDLLNLEYAFDHKQVIEDYLNKSKSYS